MNDLTDIPFLVITRTETDWVCGQFGGVYDSGIVTERSGFLDDESGCIDGYIINIVKHEDLDTAIAMLRAKLEKQKQKIPTR